MEQISISDCCKDLDIIYISQVNRSEVSSILTDAYWSGKHANDRFRSFDPLLNDDGSDYLFIKLPLSLIAPNEVRGRLYGSVDVHRVESYSHTEVQKPIKISFKQRSLSIRSPYFFVIDGCHRVSAARRRNDTHIPAIIQANDLLRYFEMMRLIQSETSILGNQSVHKMALR